MARLEVEAKIQVPCTRLDKLRRLLIDLGAEKEEERLEEDLYLAHPCRSFHATDEALRLRRVNGALHTLTYKGPRLPGEVKARPEAEASASEALLEILERLGFHPAYKVEKHREYYRLGDATITLDRVKGLGCFIEVEARDPGRVEETLKRLNLEGPVITESYLELLIRRGHTRRQHASGQDKP